MNRRKFCKTLAAAAAACALPGATNAPLPYSAMRTAEQKRRLFAEMYGMNPAHLRVHPYQKQMLIHVSNPAGPSGVITPWHRGAGKTNWLRQGTTMHLQFEDVEARVLASLENKTEIQKLLAARDA